MTADRPPHIIAPDEVDAWLADSAVRVVTYHRTDSASARSIVERGVDIARCRIGAYAQGLYSATIPREGFGDATLVVAVRLTRALSGSSDEIERQVDRLIVEQYGSLRPITPHVSAALRRRFVSLG